ncbi:MAG: threonine/serine exporter family protein [Actinomycetia bacterium]|nr:threonine/serine exporter family protein [Actinomycetes bacterium]
MNRQSRQNRRRRIADAVRKTPATALAPPDSYDPDDVAAMLREIGIALVEVAQPTSIVKDRLTRIADHYTTERVRTVVLPTMLLIQIGRDAYEIDGSTRSSLQLDAAGTIDHIAGLAEAGAITPTDAVAAVAAARSQPPRFGKVATITASAVTSVGFGMMINPTWAALPGYFFLGLVVGAILMLGEPLPSLTPILPTLSAFVVTLLASWFVADTAGDGLLRVISPALVAAIPGMALANGATELAASQIMSGSSRLVYGISQLALLVFGVIMGMHLAGPVAPQAPSPQMGSWSLYLAIIVVGLSLSVYLSAPRGSLFWLTAAIAVALITQQLAGIFFASTHAGFLGAVMAVLFANLAARIKTSPPAVVLILAAFWSLVPSTTSFMSVSQAATGGNGDMASLGQVGSAILSIALGTLVGWSIFQTIASRLPWSKAIPV